MGGPAQGPIQFARQEDWAYAVNMIETVTWLAGRPDYLDDLAETFASLKLFETTKQARSARLFEWLAAAMSYQGISDTVARTYMADHGRPRWRGIAHGVNTASCRKLKSYWHFHGCAYRKSGATCAMPHLIETCPLPAHVFRNGNLNQLAYSLFLFIRDVTNGDLVGWLYGSVSDGRLGRTLRCSHDLYQNSGI